MNIALNEVRFTGYPTHHLLGIVTDVDAMQRLTAELDRLGVPLAAVKGFSGTLGARQFGGGDRGLRSWIHQLGENVTGTADGRLTYVDALKEGHYVVAVDLQGRSEDKQAVAEAFKAVGAWYVNFLGAFMYESLT